MVPLFSLRFIIHSIVDILFFINNKWKEVRLISKQKNISVKIKDINKNV